MRHIIEEQQERSVPFFLIEYFCAFMTPLLIAKFSADMILKVKKGWLMDSNEDTKKTTGNPNHKKFCYAESVLAFFT